MQVEFTSGTIPDNPLLGRIPTGGADTTYLTVGVFQTWATDVVVGVAARIAGAVAVLETIYADLGARLAVTVVAVVIALTAHAHILIDVAFVLIGAIVIVDAACAYALVAKGLVAVIVIHALAAIVGIRIADIVSRALLIFGAAYAALVFDFTKGCMRAGTDAVVKTFDALVVVVADLRPIAVVVDLAFATSWKFGVEITASRLAIVVGGAGQALAAARIADPVVAVTVAATGTRAAIFIAIADFVVPAILVIFALPATSAIGLLSVGVGLIGVGVLSTVGVWILVLIARIGVALAGVARIGRFGVQITFGASRRHKYECYDHQTNCGP